MISQVHQDKRVLYRESFQSSSLIRNNPYKRGIPTGMTFGEVSGRCYGIFDGTTSYIDLGTGVVPELSDFSMSFWMLYSADKLALAGADKTIFTTSDATTGMRLYVKKDYPTGGDVRLVFDIGVTGGHAYSLNIDVAKWNHIVVTKVGQDIAMYVNAVDVTDDRTTTAMVSGVYKGTLGCRLDSGVTPVDLFGGWVGDFCIWRTALTSAEVSCLYNNSLYRRIAGSKNEVLSSTDLLASWDFQVGWTPVGGYASCTPNEFSVTADGGVGIVLPLVVGSRYKVHISVSWVVGAGSFVVSDTTGVRDYMTAVAGDGVIDLSFTAVTTGISLRIVGAPGTVEIKELSLVAIVSDKGSLLVDIDALDGVARDRVGKYAMTLNGVTYGSINGDICMSFLGASTSYLGFASDIIGAQECSAEFWVYIKGVEIGAIFDSGTFKTSWITGTGLRVTNNGGTVSALAAQKIEHKLRHFVVTRSAGGTINMYMEGKVGATVNQYTAQSVAGTAFRVGNAVAGSAPFKSFIRNFRLFNRVLTPEEISRCFNSSKQAVGY